MCMLFIDNFFKFANIFINNFKKSLSFYYIYYYRRIDLDKKKKKDLIKTHSVMIVCIMLCDDKIITSRYL